MINDYEKETNLEELENKIENENNKKVLEPVKKVVEKQNKRPVKMLIGKIANDRTRLRKEPEEYTDVLSLLRKGDLVVVDRNEILDDYYLVTAHGIVGYVSKDAIIIN